MGDPSPGDCGSFRKARDVCMGDIFILYEIWAQRKTYICIGTLLG
jgi:hypothetical protein